MMHDDDDCASCAPCDCEDDGCQECAERAQRRERELAGQHAARVHGDWADGMADADGDLLF